MRFTRVESAGVNTFVYAAITDSTAQTLVGEGRTFDVITDFKQVDKISLTGLFTADDIADFAEVENAIGGLDPTFANIVAAAEAAIGQNRFGAFQFGTNTYILGSASVAGTADDLFIELTGNVNLAPTDFTFV